MTRLPTVNGDQGAWGTVLNDFLTTNITDTYTLAGGTSVGAGSIVLNRAPQFPPLTSVVIAIDPYTTECELRPVSSITGNTINFSGGLRFTHSDGDKVFIVAGGFVPLPWFGAEGDGSTNDTNALRQAFIECGREGLWVEGLNKNYRVTKPLVARPGGKFKHGKMTANTGYAPDDSTGAMLMSSQGLFLTFTADAATDVITTSANHLLPGDNLLVALYGPSLPAPLVEGRMYYCRDRTSNTFKVAATSGGAAIDLTTSGSGDFYGEVQSLNRLYLDDWYIDGLNLVKNGIIASVQQPCFWWKPRINNVTEVAVMLSGQQCEFYNLEIGSCQVGLQLGIPHVGVSFASMMRFFDLDIEGPSVNLMKVAVAGDYNNVIYGLHSEDAGHQDLVYFDWTIGGELTLYGASFSPSFSALSNQVIFDMGTAVTNQCSYTIEDIHINGSGVTGNTILLRDNYRGNTVYVSKDGTNASIARTTRGLYASRGTDAGVSDQYYSGLNLFGWNGKEIQLMPGQRVERPAMMLRAGTGLTADIIEVYDTANVKKFAIAPSGRAKLLNGADVNGPLILSGSGTPEGAVSAPVGSLYMRSDGSTNTAIYRKETGTGNTGWVATATAAGTAPILNIALLNFATASQAYTWTNMPTAETLLFNVGNNKVPVDLTNYTQIRWNFWLNVAGSAGAKLYVKYATTVNGTYNAIDGSTGTEIAIDTGSATHKLSSWVNLVAGAKADIWVAVYGSGGDATVDPGFGSMFLQFK